MTSVEVTVLIPVFNRAELLDRCLRSVVAQKTTASIQVLVVDDCSTDGSGDVARNLGAEVLRTDQNVGCGGARNVGVALAAGKWIAFVDSDDSWHEDHLETLVSHSAGVGLVSTCALTHDGDRLRVVGHPYPWAIDLREPADVLGPENVVAISAAMVKTELVRRVGGFPTRRYADDLDLWTRVLSLEPGRVLPRLTVAYRSHSGQVSADPEMLIATAALLEDLDRQGLIGPRQMRAVMSARRWDERDGTGLVWIAGELLARRMHAGSLARVLTARVSQRQRWKLQPRRARELALGLNP